MTMKRLKTHLWTGALLAMSCSTSPTDKSSLENASAKSNGLSESWTFDSSIRALEVTDSNGVWWAGSNGLVGHTWDGGLQWQVDTLKLNDGTLPAFRSMAVTSEAAFAFSIASPAVLFRFDFFTQEWDSVYTNHDEAAFFDSMAFWDDKEGIAMGDAMGDEMGAVGSSCLSVLITRDGGRNWNRIPCGDLPPLFQSEDGTAEAAFAASNGNVVLHGDEVWIATGGAASRIYRSRDRGRSWEVVSTPIIQGGTMTGMFSATRCGDAMGIGWGGNWEDMDDNASNKIQTLDGGATWHLWQPGEGPGYRSSVQFVPQTDCQGIWAVGIPGISQSWDGGQTWLTEPDSTFLTLRFDATGTKAWLAGRGVVRCQSVNRP